MWMKREDLGGDCDGWQVIDSTPQEKSDGNSVVVFKVIFLFISLSDSDTSNINVYLLIHLFTYSTTSSTTPLFIIYFHIFVLRDRPPIP